MAITTDQYNKILTRLTSIETHINDIMISLDKFVTLGQVNQILTILESDIESASTQVEALEARVTAIEEEPLT